LPTAIRIKVKAQPTFFLLFEYKPTQKFPLGGGNGQG